MTLILEAMKRGEEGAEEHLFHAVYQELRRMARGRAFRMSSDHTLQATALVHEAYLRLVKDDSAAWENRQHFFGAAARAMRQILVDRERKRRAVIHGGELQKVPLEDVPDAETPVDLIALDDALNQLAKEHPRHAEMVTLRFFIGLTVQETAGLLKVSPKTVDNDWALAKSWLRREMLKGRH